MREIVTNLRSQPCVMLSLYPVLFIADDLGARSDLRTGRRCRPTSFGARTTPRPRSRIWWTIAPVLRRKHRLNFNVGGALHGAAVFCLSSAPDAQRKSAKNESEDEFKKKKKRKTPDSRSGACFWLPR